MPRRRGHVRGLEHTDLDAAGEEDAGHRGLQQPREGGGQLLWQHVRARRPHRPVQPHGRQPHVGVRPLPGPDRQGLLHQPGPVRRLARRHAVSDGGRGRRGLRQAHLRRRAPPLQQTK